MKLEGRWCVWGGGGSPVGLMSSPAACLKAAGALGASRRACFAAVQGSESRPRAEDLRPAAPSEAGRPVKNGRVRGK